MKRLFYFITITISQLVFAQTDTIVFNDFTGSRKFIDNTMTLLWGTNTAATSAFDIKNTTDKNNLTYPALQRLDAAKDQNGWSHPKLCMSTAFDYEFPKTILRKNDTLSIEFDLMFDALDKNGENGRIVVMLMHDYPQGGAKFGNIDSINSEHPYGRPAYNFRIKNRTNQGSTTYGFIMYGGGKDSLGELEKNVGNGVWYPGFSSTAGGFTPGLGGSLGGVQYPFGPNVIKTEKIAVEDEWMHWTWKIYPERLEVYSRLSAQAPSSDQLIMFAEIPDPSKGEALTIQQMNTAHSTNTDSLPILYHWFNEVNAVRFFSRWANNKDVSNFYISNVNIMKTNNTIVSTNDIDLETKSKLSAYPNPAENRVFIKNAEGKVELTDAYGRTVKELIEGQNNLSNIQSGIYYIKSISSISKLIVR